MMARRRRARRRVVRPETRRASQTTPRETAEAQKRPVAKAVGASAGVQPLFDLGIGHLLWADRRLSLLLAAVLLVAFLVRLNGYDFGLPYQLQPDEPNLFIRALQLSRTGQTDWAVRTPPGYVEVLRFLIAAGQIVFGPDVAQAQLFALGRLVSVVAG